jgi:hypothetical protein
MAWAALSTAQPLVQTPSAPPLLAERFWLYLGLPCQGPADTRSSVVLRHMVSSLGSALLQKRVHVPATRARPATAL